VLESIRALSTHRTLVVVTHRPEVAALAARVVTLDPISKLAAE
jgi:ABC-type lipoprotein export system ATPase subunit